jgi:hypothetical protein
MIALHVRRCCPIPRPRGGGSPAVRTPRPPRTPRAAAASTMAASEGVTPASRFARTPLANQTFANPAPHGAREVAGTLVRLRALPDRGIAQAVLTPGPVDGSDKGSPKGTASVHGAVYATGLRRTSHPPSASGNGIAAYEHLSSSRTQSRRLFPHHQPPHKRALFTRRHH